MLHTSGHNPTTGPNNNYLFLSEDTSKPLDAAAIKQVQQITGTLLYYVRAVDATILMALGTIAAQQAQGTEATTIAINHLLDY
jgi:Zn-dependent M28 family amino/carboxypeptidase